MAARMQRQALFNFLLVAAFLSGCSDDFGAETGLGIIEGSVHDSNGDPIRGASISFVLTLDEAISMTDGQLPVPGVVLRAGNSEDQHISLKIYRPDGSLIRTLIDGPAEAETPMSWDGRDDSGRLAPVNAYTVELIISELRDGTPTEIVHERVVVFHSLASTSDLYEAYHVQTDSTGRFFFDAETSLGFDALIRGSDENGDPITTRVSRQIQAYAIIGENGVATAFHSRSIEFPRGSHFDLTYVFNSLP